MNLNLFRTTMQKPIFKSAEAQVVCFKDNPNFVNLQLHQWLKRGALVRLKRGVYAFANIALKAVDIAKTLYEPCYFSLEYALSVYGILPEAVFGYTLVTPKTTRTFNTPLGTFYYHHVKPSVFTGFSPDTLMAVPEKALVDYFYLHQANLESTTIFWAEARLTTNELDFKKMRGYAKQFESKKLLVLLSSLEDYAKSD